MKDETPAPEIVDHSHRLEEAALHEYETHLGKTIRVLCVDGYDDHDNSQTVFIEGGLLVRVAATERTDVVRWMGKRWLDPVWNVEPVEQHPKIEGLRRLWIQSTTYDGKTGRADKSVYEDVNPA